MTEVQAEASSSKHGEISPRSCRVCTAEKETMWPIFGPNTDDLISVKLSYCTGLKVTQRDGKPMQICKQCLENLDTAHQFKELCLSSDALFEEILKHIRISTSVKIEPVNVQINVKNELCDSDNSSGQSDVEETSSRDEQMNKKHKEINKRSEEVKLLTISTLIPNTGTSKSVLEINPLNKEKLIKVVKKKSLGAESVLNIKDKRIANMIIKQISTELINTEVVKKKKDVIKKKKPVINKIRSLKKNIQRVQCDSCDFRCERKKELEAHIKAEHPEQQRKYVCELCGKEYSSKASIYYHVNTHKPPKFKCKLCDYESHSRDGLQKHSTVHTGEKKFKCEYCALAFAVSSNLKVHIRRSHLKDMPHKCHICDKAFVAPSYLKQHMESHMNVKNKSCDICDAKFAGRKQWKRHMLNQHNIVVPSVRSGRKRDVDLSSSPP